MTDATASLPPELLPAHPPSGNAPGLEDDSVRIAEDGQFWLTEDGPTFAEVLDIPDPLHHIPGISTIYRAITGDEIGAGPLCRRYAVLRPDRRTRRRHYCIVRRGKRRQSRRPSR